MHRWMARTLAAFALAAASPSFAARDFTPQSGTWIVSQELDGKPGRGLAIDVQGNTFFMQVFGYEKNGDATFYTATGQMDGNQVTAPLMRYKGGRSFGSAARDAVEDGSLGNVTVSFKNGLKGAVQFPGESVLAIERFLVQSDEPGVTNPRKQMGLRSMQMLVQDAQGAVVYDWQADLSLSDSNAFKLVLKQPYNPYLTSLSYLSFQEMTCHLAGARARYTCEAVGKPPYMNGTQVVLGPWVDRLQFELAGNDLAGTVVMGDKQSGLSMSVAGYGLGASASGSSRREGGKMWVEALSQNYLATNVSVGGICIPTGPCPIPENLNTLMPINGTWIVEEELTGKPGRGMALDIQGNTAILQVYSYRADQQPTFHIGSARYASKGANTFATTASIPMDEYAGGRSLGGAPQSAQLRHQAGNAQLEFAYQKSTDKPMEDWMWWTVGQLQLPQESPVRIRRLQLEKPASAVEELLGHWYLPFTRKTLALTRVEGDSVMTADGVVVCSLISNRPGAEVSCGQPGEKGWWTWHQFLTKPVMNRGGDMVRLRDRHGNAVGLGQLD